MTAKKLIVPIFFVLLTAMGLTSCQDEEPVDGDWPAMEWIPAFGEDRGTHHISVPAEGGIYQFECQNYNLWFQSLRVNDEYIRDTVIVGFHDITWEWFTASINENVLTVKIEPNDSGEERSCKIDVTAGDISDVFCFEQKGE